MRTLCISLLAVALLAGSAIGVAGQSEVETRPAAIASVDELFSVTLDEASAEVTALAEDAASVNVKKITNRIGANEDDIAALQEKTTGLSIANLKKRIGANEDAIAALQESDRKQDERITALEEAALEAVPLPE